MHEVEDEPLFAERVAGIDIAKAGVEVTIWVPSDTTPGRRQQETRTFAATRAGLLPLADWLRCWGVTKLGMARIANSPAELRREIAKAGQRPKVVLEATYGWVRREGA